MFVAKVALAPQPDPVNDLSQPLLAVDGVTLQYATRDVLCALPIASASMSVARTVSSC